MNVMDSNTAWQKRACYFSGHLPPEVTIEMRHFRSGARYDATPNPESFGLRLIENFGECAGKRMLLFFASEEVPLSPLQLKKGALWGSKKLRRQPYVSFSTECSPGRGRLGVIVDLDGFDFLSEHEYVLNWYYGAVIISDLPITHVAKLASSWGRTSKDDFLSYSCEAISKALAGFESAGVLRYFPPDNQRLETIAIIANQKFFSESVRSCFDRIEHLQSGNA